jgi:branched-chain amino acid transport system substrate-binding protein
VEDQFVAVARPNGGSPLGLAFALHPDIEVSIATWPLMRRRGWSAALALGVLGCGPHPPGAIGFAYGIPDSASLVTVLRAELSQARDPRAPQLATLPAGIIQRSPPGLPAGAVEVAAWIVKVPGIVGAVGPADSRASLLAAPIYAEAGVPQIVPNSTSRLLRDAGPWTFTLSPDDSLEGAFIGAFIVDSLAARSATIFYDEDEYGVGLRDGVQHELDRRGRTVLAALSIRDVCSGTADASIALGVPAAAPPSVVVVATRAADAICIARRVLVRLPRMRFVAGDGVEFNAAYRQEAGAVAQAFYTVAFWDPAAPGESASTFRDRFRSVVGRDPLPTDALIYDAVMVLAEAARRNGGRRAAMRDYLRSLGRSIPPYQGVTGPIMLGGAGLVATARPMVMLRAAAAAP